MSIVSALDNSNRTLRLTEVSASTASGASHIYVTIPMWPPFATLTRIFVSANNTYSNLTAAVLTDGAAFRAGTAAPIGSPQATATDSASGVANSVFSMGGAYVEDAQRVGYLYVMLSTTGAFTTGTVFTVTAEGHAALAETRAANETAQGIYDPSWRVLYLPSGASSAQDRTLPAMRNGNPFVQGPTDASESFLALSAPGDTLYIGSSRRFTRFNVLCPKYAHQPSGAVLTAQVWDGNTWATGTILDNTSDGATAPSSFSYSGVMSLVTPTAWALTDVVTDPLYILQQGVYAGTQPPTICTNPRRYWLSLRLSSVSPALKLVGLQPLL